VSCYSLGAVNPTVDLVACNSQFPPGAARDACMVAKGYYQSSPGHWEHHSGISPTTAIAAGLALVGLPIAVKAVVKGIEGVTSSSQPKTTPAPDTSTIPYGPFLPGQTPAPINSPVQYGPPAPAAPSVVVSDASLLPTGISPWILVLAGAGLLFALSRKG